MKIQKGLVKYKDRSDIVCTYGITDDGRQFYFLNDSKLSNNNIIVTSTLVEAIDSSVVHSNVGLIDADGNVVIPCENKNIKLITKDILLVEKATPTSPCVVEACEIRKDPLAATKLVSTTAAIKDKVFAEMGTDGRFLFNDQFSEASLFDLNGKNLIQDKYYSFVAINKVSDTIFLSDNTKESVVDKFSLTTMTLNDSTNVPSGEVPENAGFTDIDVNDVSVNKEDIDNAMTATEQAPIEEVVTETQETVSESITPEVPAEETVQEEVQEVANEEVSQEATPEEVVNVETPVAQEENAEDVVSAPVEETVQEAIAPAEDVVASTVETPTPYEVVEAPATEEYVANVVETPTPYDVVEPTAENVVDEEVISVPVQENVEPELPIPEVSVVENEVQEEVAPAEEVEEAPITLPAINYDKFNVVEESHIEENVEETPVEDNKVEKIEDDNLLDQVNFDHKYETSSIDDLFGDLDNTMKEEMKPERTDSFDDFLSDLTKKEEVKNLDVRSTNYNESYNYSAPKTANSIMDSAAITISRLIEANKNQMSELDEYKHQVQELTDLNRKVVDRAKQDRDMIRTSIQNYEDQIERLKSQMDSLEDRIRDKERIIHSQTDELSNLRSQVEGSNNLAKILEDAQSILGGNNRY